MIKVHTVQGNYRGNTILIAADLAQVKVEYGFIQWSDLKSDENLKKNPLGQVPYISTTEGVITQTNACLRYVANISKTLYGSDIVEQAQVDQWLDFVANNFMPAINPILYKIWGFKGEISDDVIKQSKDAVDELSTILNEQLKLRTYLVGNSISMADIALYCALVYAQRCVLSGEYRKKFQHLTRWYENLSNNPSVKKYFGTNRYVQKPWF